MGAVRLFVDHTGTTSLQGSDGAPVSMGDYRLGRVW